MTWCICRASARGVNLHKKQERTNFCPLFRCIAFESICLEPEQIRHDRDICVASVVQTGQIKAGFQGLKQGEVVVERAAGQTLRARVGVDDGDYLIGFSAVVVLVPNSDNHVVAFAPHRGGFDRFDESAYGCVSLCNGVLIHRASGAHFGRTTTMLVMALVGDDEGEVRHVPASQICEKSVKTDNPLQAVCLDTGKVHEWIVLDGVE